MSGTNNDTPSNESDTPSDENEEKCLNDESDTPSEEDGLQICEEEQAALKAAFISRLLPAVSNMGLQPALLELFKALDGELTAAEKQQCVDALQVLPTAKSIRVQINKADGRSLMLQVAKNASVQVLKKKIVALEGVEAWTVQLFAPWLAQPLSDCTRLIKILDQQQDVSKDLDVSLFMTIEVGLQYEFDASLSHASCLQSISANRLSLTGNPEARFDEDGQDPGYKWAVCSPAIKGGGRWRCRLRVDSLTRNVTTDANFGIGDMSQYQNWQVRG